ncbi:hypothetical protein [Streptomyces sp. NBC_00829]|nr:hypothetical protein OG293_30490 [Streptomyces sp. NBC_00829]
MTTAVGAEWGCIDAVRGAGGHEAAAGEDESEQDRPDGESQGLPPPSTAR